MGGSRDSGRSLRAVITAEVAVVHDGGGRVAALGIGATTAVFTLVTVMLLRSSRDGYNLRRTGLPSARSG